MIYIPFRDQMQEMVSPRRPSKPTAINKKIDELTDAGVEAVLIERREYTRLEANYQGQMEAYSQRFDQIYTEFARALRAHYAPWATDAQAEAIYNQAHETGHSGMKRLESQYDDYAAFAQVILITRPQEG